jgi:cell division protein ZapA
MIEDFKQVPVHILGKEYLVACRPHEQEELVQTARFLDRKMREIRDSGKVVGTERIAVMAGLNIAHELLKGGKGTGSNAATALRIKALQEKIESALLEQERQAGL